MSESNGTYYCHWSKKWQKCHIFEPLHPIMGYEVYALEGPNKGNRVMSKRSEIQMADVVGIEPTTLGFGDRCSTN